MNPDCVIKDYVDGEYTLQRMCSLSNFVYLLKSAHQTLVYREYSNHFIIFLDRQSEVRLQNELATLKLAPNILYSDDIQRIEEYLPYKQVDLKDLKNEYYQVAHMLGNFHRLKDVERIKNIYPPMAAIQRKLQNPKLQATIMSVIHNQTQTTLSAKQKIIKSFDYVFSQKVQDKIQFLFQKKCLSDLPLVIAHNDLNSTNFLKDQAGNFHLIDFEYAGLNYPGYEIANFFNEMEWDYTYKEPPYFKVSKKQGLTDEQKMQFIKQYWQTFSGDAHCQVPPCLLQQIEVGHVLQNYFWLFIGALSLQYQEKSIDLEEYIDVRIQKLNKII